MVSLADALIGVFRHGNLLHLSGNLFVIFLGGLLAEQRLGSGRLALFMLVCATLGTLVQFVMVGPHFVGASSISYGLLSYGTLAARPPTHMALASAAIVALVALEFAFSSAQIAVYVHATGAFIGGTFAMFENLFGSKNPRLKPMQLTHINRVVQIINQTDEDDAEEASAQFLDGGLDGMFVLVQQGDVLGVTGYSFDEHVSDIAWLSWTYLDNQYTGAGLGSQMMNDLLGKLKDAGIRKVFIATSDYKACGKTIYAAAHAMYEDFGATVELTIPDYHAPGEARIVYGLVNPEYGPPPPDAPSENDGIGITDIRKEPETDGVMGLCWEERPVGIAGLDYALDKASKKGARAVVLAIPSDISDANSDAFLAQKFTNYGVLSDYYSPALHQVWWGRPAGQT